jgi:hypothetical protein
MTRRELAELCCRMVLVVEPTNYFFRSMLEAIKAHPERYPTPRQWYWIRAKAHEMAERERDRSRRPRPDGVAV